MDGCPTRRPQVLADLSDAVVKTMLSGQAIERYTDRRPGSCFDMFGIDIMFEDLPNPLFGQSAGNNSGTHACAHPVPPDILFWIQARLVFSIGIIIITSVMSIVREFERLRFRRGQGTQSRRSAPSSRTCSS